MPFRTLLCLLFSLSTTPYLMAQGTDSVYTNAERMPYFPGCTVFNHIVYPQAAKDANLEGAVYVRFVVDELGKIQSPELLKDIGGGCGTLCPDGNLLFIVVCG